MSRRKVTIAFSCVVAWGSFSAVCRAKAYFRTLNVRHSRMLLAGNPGALRAGKTLTSDRDGRSLIENEPLSREDLT
jgi:hypothetical protein